MNEMNIITGFNAEDINTLKGFIGKRLIKIRHLIWELHDFSLINLTNSMQYNDMSPKKVTL